MKNIFKNKNFWIVASLLTVALVLLLTTAGQRGDISADPAEITKLPVMDASGFSFDGLMNSAPKSSFVPSLFSAVAEEEAPVTYTREDLEAVYTADAYVLVTFANWGMRGIIALPAEEEGEVVVPLQQPTANDDGELITNELHLTHDSVFIASANCDSQDCVYQGVVSLDNKDSRILGNMIICSPHGLLLELFTRDELIDYILSAQY